MNRGHLGELLMEREETEQMVFDTAAGVVGASARAEDEGPAAGLGEQLLALGLFQVAQLEADGGRKAPGIGLFVPGSAKGSHHHSHFRTSRISAKSPTICLSSPTWHESFWL